jgi:hypothetical protein
MAANDTSPSLSTALEAIRTGIKTIEEHWPDHVPELGDIQSRSAQRRRRLDRRDALLRELAEEHYPKPTGRAAAIVAALHLFRTGTYRHSARGDSPEQALMRAILGANKARAPGKRQVQLILAGNRTPPAK